MTGLHNDQVPDNVPEPRCERVPRAAALLGAAGLMPVVGAVLAILVINPQASPHEGIPVVGVALVEIGYAVLIFNFLGGLWWGLAARTKDVDWLYLAAISPTLLTLLLLATPAYIGSPTGLLPSLGTALGLAILLTLPVDLLLTRQGKAPIWWMSLRLPLSLGLGIGTMAVALLVPA